MQKYIILLPLILFSINSLRILFSPGSLVKKTFYNNFIHSLENKINRTICFYSPFENLDDKKIIISHSFGGTTILYDYIHNIYLSNHSDIIAVVLIQSHFNQRYKMPYFGINQHKINIPVLTVLNVYDDRLPLYCSIDDFLVSYQENIPDKYFLINNGTHFSSFEDKMEIERLTTQVGTFILEVLNNEFYRMRSIFKYITKKHEWFFQERNLTNTIKRSSLIDFLMSRPHHNNSFYDNDKFVLYKTNNVNISQELNTYYHLNIAYNYTLINFDKHFDYLNSTDTVVKISSRFLKGIDVFTFYLFVEFFIKEFTNELLSTVQIPQILYKWFTYEPSVYIQNKTLVSEVICIPIKDNIVYYKFPNKHIIFDFLMRTENL